MNGLRKISENMTDKAKKMELIETTEYIRKIFVIGDEEI